MIIVKEKDEIKTYIIISNCALFKGTSRKLYEL